MTTLRAVLATATGAVLALLLTACGPVYPQGPAGTVTDKSRHYRSANKTWKRYLTVQTSDGTQHTFRVSLSDYVNCDRDSAYPQCTQRGQESPSGT